MLLVQEFLLTNSLQNLIDKHGVYSSLSNDKTKISLNYSQIESNCYDALANQCRGLILRKLDGSTFDDNKSKTVGQTIVIDYPFDRFLNYEQNKNFNFNEKCKFYKKLDGSLIILYYDVIINKWFVATRSVSEANVIFNGHYTFKQLFELALREQYNLNYDDFTKIAQEICHPFRMAYELCYY